MRGNSHGQVLASFGGITRIRFKGSSEFLGPLSQAAPPHLFLAQSKTRVGDVNTRDRASRGSAVTPLGQLARAWERE